MVWLTWRQHRSQALVAAGFLAVVGGVLLAHGLRTADLTARLAPGSADLTSVLAGRFGQLARATEWFAALPALAGVFWGVPLVGREYERGTYVLAWTQSVSRRAWLGVKLAGLGGAVALAGLAFGAIMTAWAGGFALLPNAGRMSNEALFSVTGVVPAGWWLFVFAVGAAAGAVLRRTLPAVAVTLAVFIAAYVTLLATGARAHYAAPLRVELDTPSIDGAPWLADTPRGAVANIPAGAALVAQGWVGGSADARERTCPNMADDYLSCMRDNGFRWFAEYQPADRYWRFQWTETGLLMVGTLAAGGVVWYRVARRAA